MEFWGKSRQLKKKSIHTNSLIFHTIQFKCRGRYQYFFFQRLVKLHVADCLIKLINPPHQICLKYYIFLSSGVSTLYVRKPLIPKKILDKNTKFEIQTFAHFWPLERQKFESRPPLPCRTETKYEQMFFCTEP